jgi:hypothetical protein
MSSDKQLHSTLKIIAVLLFANLCTDLYDFFIPEAHATGTIDCKIVDISSNIYSSLPIKIEGIGNISSYELPVKVTDWDAHDEVKVKVTDWDTSDTVKVQTQ